MIVIYGVFFHGCSRTIFHRWKKLDAPARFFIDEKIEILFHLLFVWHGQSETNGETTTTLSWRISARILWSFAFHLDTGYSWYNYSWVFPVLPVGSFCSSGFVGSNRASSSGTYSGLRQVSRVWVSLCRGSFRENSCSLGPSSFSQRGSFQTSRVLSYRSFRECSLSCHLWVFTWRPYYLHGFLQRDYPFHLAALCCFSFRMSSPRTPCASASFVSPFAWQLLVLWQQSYRQNRLEFRSQVFLWLSRWGRIWGVCLFSVPW